MDSSVPVTVEKKKTKKKKVRSSSSSNKASSVEPTQASNVDATKIRKKKQRPGEGKKKTKKKFRFQRPDVLNPLKQIGMIKECLQSGEEGVLKKPEVWPDWIPTFTARCFEMIVKEPSEAKYRLFYALLLWDKKPKEEVISLFEQAIHCDESYFAARDAFCLYLEKQGEKKRALEIYEAAFDNLYRRQTTVDDVNLLTLFGAFAFENKLEEQKAKLSGVWKDCALLNPSLDMTQGNFGLFLHQNGDVEAAKTRIETAAKNGNAYWKKVQARLFEE